MGIYDPQKVRMKNLIQKTMGHKMTNRMSERFIGVLWEDLVSQ